MNSLKQEQLQEKILKNVETVISLQEQKDQNIPNHQRLLESIATTFGQPWFLYAEVLFFASWSLLSHLAEMQLINWSIPKFSFQEQGIDIASLIISTGVLIYQTRQEEVSEERAHLALQLSLISEQKIAKLIALVEELRLDLPDVRDRLDLEAEAMQQTTNPQVVLDILQVSMKQTSIEVSELPENEKSPAN
jgi:uncharacterized membrane protein